MAVTTIFMFIAGINMTCIYFGLKGNFKKVFNNNEFIFYSIITFTFIVIISLVLNSFRNFLRGKAIKDGTFHVISIITTTGFYTKDYNMWGDIIIMLFFVLMFTGGTAGSTSGGIKIVRLLLITKNNRQELKRLIHPNGFIPVRHNDKSDNSTIYNF